MAFLICTSLDSSAAGIFDGHQDIGTVSRKGGVFFPEGGGKVYEITGGGANMWFTNDAFHFAWKKVSGDFRFQAGVAWPGSGGNAHRKACLVVRQDLDADSAYIDVAVHGDGLTSLQFRDAKGGQTREVQANQKGPAAVGIERQGDTFVLLLGPTPGSLQPAGPFMRVRLADPVYVGLGVIPFGYSGMRVEDGKSQRAVPGLSLQQAWPFADGLPHFAWATA